MAETEDLCLGRNSVKPVLPGGNPRGRGKPRPYKDELPFGRGEERPASEGGPYHLGGDLCAGADVGGGAIEFGAIPVG